MVLILFEEGETHGSMEDPLKSKNALVTYAREDLEAGRYDRVLTRFAPEPNAFIHLGSAISCAMSFGLAEELGGTYNLRFDDTNPDSAKPEFVEAIREDLHWLGYEWTGEFFASDYFETLSDWAKILIEKGQAYVCDLSEDEIRELRGTNSFDADGKRITPDGVNSPYRNRSADENLALFDRMREGEFGEGEKTLRAKIDMSHDNLLMRDPIMYRIRHSHHHRTGDSWCIYPTYDWAHGQSDSIEGVTHSICGLEFRSHRPLYDWFLDELGVFHPRQIEYTRINVTHTITGKRYLLRLVEEGLVDGWDDPRLPTLRALRRRGYPPEAIRRFCAELPVSDRKLQSTVEVELFEHVIRDYLNAGSQRYFGVLRPLKLIITNYPENAEEELKAVKNPEDPESGTRKIPFSRELYIERDDFIEDPPKKFYRLTPGREVRLRYAYFVTCTGVVKNDNGDVIEVHCTYDPETRGGDAPDGRRVKSTLHWVSANHAITAEVRIYERLFLQREPLKEKGEDAWMNSINKTSVEVISDCAVEPALAALAPSKIVQFERIGYFCADRSSTNERPIFLRTLSLKDEWRKVQKAAKAEANSERTD